MSALSFAFWQSWHSDFGSYISWCCARQQITCSVTSPMELFKLGFLLQLCRTPQTMASLGHELLNMQQASTNAHI